MAVDPKIIGKNIQRFRIGVNAHDRENPTHTAYGIGLSPYDMEHMGFDEGEEILPGIRIETDDGEPGSFRVLCDGDHLQELEAEEAEVVDAVSTQRATIPVGAPGDAERQ